MPSGERLLAWSMIAAYVVLNSAGAVAIKHQIQRSVVPSLTSLPAVAGFLGHMFTAPLVLIGFTAIALSACAWILALSRVELSTAYPVAVALNCAIVVSAGLSLYGESLSSAKLLGIGLLVVSLLLLFRG